MTIRTGRLPQLIMVAGLACLLALAAWFVFVARGKQVVFHKSDCDRIRIGMTREEVQHELGLPPGDYTTDLVMLHEFFCNCLLFP